MYFKEFGQVPVPIFNSNPQNTQEITSIFWFMNQTLNNKYIFKGLYRLVN